MDIRKGIEIRKPYGEKKHENAFLLPVMWIPDTEMDGQMP